MDASTELKLGQMSKDMNRMADDFAAHTDQDEKRFDSIQSMLQRIEGKMDIMQTKLEDVERKIDPILEIYDGLRFGSKTLLWTAAIVGALTVIGAPALWAYHHFYKP